METDEPDLDPVSRGLNQSGMGQAANVRTARGTFEVRAADRERFGPLAVTYQIAVIF